MFAIVNNNIKKLELIKNIIKKQSYILLYSENN